MTDPTLNRLKDGIVYALYLIGGFLFAAAVMLTLALVIMFIVGLD